MAQGKMFRTRKPIVVKIARKPRRKAKKNGLFSNKSRAILPYYDMTSIDPGAGTLAVQVFHANGIYDPDITSVTNHQPRGRDQMQAFYNHYHVTSSKIRVFFNVPGADVQCIVGISIQSNAAPLSSVTEYMESAHTRYSICNSNEHKQVMHSFSAKSFFGTPVSSEKDNFGDTGKNPMEGAYFHIFAMAADYTSNPGVIPLICNLKYNTVFTEPKQPPIS